MKMRNYVLLLIVMLSFGLLAEVKLTELSEIRYETLNINGNKNLKIIKPIFIDNKKIFPSIIKGVISFILKRFTK